MTGTSTHLTGMGNVEDMKKLAINGLGLNTFINQYVRKRYAVELN